MKLNEKFEDRLKETMCSEGKPLGKFAAWLARVFVPTTIEVDVRGYDVFETYCWCCTLWRGVVVGGIIGAAVGLIIGLSV